MISIKDTVVLISKIQQINDLLGTFGVTDIAIYRPTSHREAKKLNFVGKIKEPETKDLFYIFHIEDELSKLLGYKVRFTSEDSIDDSFKELIQTNKCLLKTNKADKIRCFISAPCLFNKHIVNTQKDFINDLQEERKYNATADCEKSTENEKQEAQILEYLQSNTIVWEILTTSSQIRDNIFADLSRKQDLNDRSIGKHKSYEDLATLGNSKRYKLGK